MSQDIDIIAVSNQIANLKQQRSMAMDDVAVLIGQVESLKKQLDDAKKEIETLKEVAASATTETDNSTPAS